MFKNSYKFLGSVLVIAACFSACTKGLDKVPFASIPQEKALLTSSDVEAALIGAYNRLGDDNVYGGDMFIYSELLGDNGEINWSGTYQGMTQIFNKSIPVNNGFVQSTWLASYTTINTLNNVLKAKDSVIELKRNKVEGEAKFLRGAVYFDLVRLYAKAWNDGTPATNDGVPIVLTPTSVITEADKVPRNKVAEVYSQVIKDLTEAESLLPESNSFFANKTAAAAMLARVYLTQEDYANAAGAASRAIEYGQNILLPSYAELFPYNPDNLSAVIGNNKEDIFAMQVNTTTGVNDFSTFFSQLGRGDIEITQDHFADYEDGDLRIGGAFYQDGSSIYTSKFDMVYSAVKIIRLAEMYLVRGESNFRTGGAPVGGVAAVADINRIRARAGLPALSAGSLTLQDFFLERKHELSFEGQKLHDAKRFKLSTQGIPWNSPKLVLPIPDRERKVNPKLTQNEGY
jgi:starch-binding outer membrane protein, SusD/RagB family